MQASIPSSGILMLYDILYQTGAPQKYAHGIHTIIQVQLLINSKKKKKSISVVWWELSSVALAFLSL